VVVCSYNNAVIQVLCHTTSLREYFLSRQLSSPAVETPETAAAVEISLQSNRPRTRGAAKLEKKIDVPSDVYYPPFPTPREMMGADEAVEICALSSRSFSAPCGETRWTSTRAAAALCRRMRLRELSLRCYPYFRDPSSRMRRSFYGSVLSANP
jgi:hypothetical protein